MDKLIHFFFLSTQPLDILNVLDKKRSTGFTLIELIAVLVILAILALIVTPLVLNIVRKAKDSANRRSVDAYGKSIELAVASYLLDTGDFPTSIEELTIEYSGKEVVCGIKQLNEDSSIYLSECKVGGAAVKDSSTDDGWYHYGKSSVTAPKSYKIGDQVAYNGMNFYVIADSDGDSETVTMLKAEPLTVDEVNIYGEGHINRYTTISVGMAYNENGYGGMAYYSSEACGYVNSLVNTGCTNDYNESEVKYVVDAWSKDKIKSNDLKKDETGYSVRLITYDEYVSTAEYSHIITDYGYYKSIYDWMYNSNYYYWTMNPSEDSTEHVWAVDNDGRLTQFSGGSVAVVRPVVTIKKSAL